MVVLCVENIFLVVHLYFTEIIEMGVKDILDKDIFDAFLSYRKV